MAIHDQNYVRYEGNLKERGAWWVITRTSLRTYLSFLRTKLTLAGLWIAGPLVAIVLVLVEYGVRGQLGQFTEVEAPSGGYISFFLQVEAFSLAILFMAAGCGVISEDLRYRTFQLYFSKPISRAEYAIGKFMSLFMLGSLVTIVPTVIVGGLRLVFFAQSDFFKTVLQDTGVGLGLSILITVVFSAAVAGLSALTARTGYVVLSWIGVLLVPLILSGIVAIATSGADWASLWSLTGCLLVVSDSLLTDKPFEGPVWVAWIVLVTVGALGIASMLRRINKLEGVA